MNQSNNIYTDEFRRYRDLGLDPLPIPSNEGRPSKIPLYPGWQTKAANHEFTAQDFPIDSNMGILLGGEKHLTDIDADSPESVAGGGAQQ